MLHDINDAHLQGVKLIQITIHSPSHLHKLSYEITMDQEVLLTLL